MGSVRDRRLRHPQGLATLAQRLAGDRGFANQLPLAGSRPPTARPRLARRRPVGDQSRGRSDPLLHRRDPLVGLTDGIEDRFVDLAQSPDLRHERIGRFRTLFTPHRLPHRHRRASLPDHLTATVPSPPARRPAALTGRPGALSGSSAKRMARPPTPPPRPPGRCVGKGLKERHSTHRTATPAHYVALGTGRRQFQRGSFRLCDRSRGRFPGLRGTTREARTSG